VRAKKNLPVVALLSSNPPQPEGPTAHRHIKRECGTWERPPSVPVGKTSAEILTSDVSWSGGALPSALLSGVPLTNQVAVQMQQRESGYRSFRPYRGAQAMSIEAFGDLLVPNLEAMHRFVRRRMRTQDYVEDVVQQTLLLAFAHRHQLREPSKFKSWLYSIAVNEIRMFRRSTRKSLTLDELPTLAITDARSSPFVRCEESKRKTRLGAAMRRLHDRDRVILQFDLGEFTLSETAAAMEVSLSAAKSARFRARRRLAESMRHQAA
jgi:RNA polymerase sigma factor (sigma-70 family)